MLADPQTAFAEATFVNALLGLVGLAQVIRALAAPEHAASAPTGEADDFVHLLLAVISLGESIEGLALAPEHPGSSTDPSPPTNRSGWLR
jgi:hypothetical protein